MLLDYRCYVTQEFIGFFWKVDRSVICRTIKRIEAHSLPLFGVRRDPKITRREAEALIVDCTEQPIEWPGVDVVQHAHHSEKKKRHTLNIYSGFMADLTGTTISGEKIKECVGWFNRK
jgi:hypothetical protein